MLPRRISPQTVKNELSKINAKNVGASDINKFDIVMVTDVASGGTFMEIDAVRDGGALEGGLMFVALQDIPVNATGVIADWAMVPDVDTSAASAGDGTSKVYLSNVTKGAWVANAPAGSPVAVGTVVSKHATTGAVLLMPQANLSSELSIVKVLTGAEVKVLNATPIEVIPAPGAGKAIIVDEVEWFLDFATAAYDGVGAGENLSLKYTNGSGADLSVAVAGVGFGDASADARAIARGAGHVLTANANAVAFIASAEWFAAAGDSPVTCTVKYRIVAA
jgi:hypothetical protein